MNRYAIIIGSSKYLSEKYLDLPYCKSDAQKLFSSLCNSGFYNNKNSLLLIDVSFTQFKDALDDFFEGIEKGSFVLFYFAGHGEVLRGKSYYLAMRDTLHSKRLLVNSSFNIEMLTPYFIEKDINSYVVILDSCRSEKALQAHGVRNRSNLDSDVVKILSEEVSGEGKIFIASSRHYQNSKELSSIEHGIFTYYLIQAINSGIPEANDVPFLDIKLVYDYVFKQIALNHQNIQQTPVYSGTQIIGKVLIAPNPNFKNKVIHTPKAQGKSNNIFSRFSNMISSSLQKDIDILQKELSRHQVLLFGSVGVGKSSFLASILRYINRSRVSQLKIEEDISSSSYDYLINGLLNRLGNGEFPEITGLDMPIEIPIEIRMLESEDSIKMNIFDVSGVHIRSAFTRHFRDEKFYLSENVTVNKIRSLLVSYSVVFMITSPETFREDDILFDNLFSKLEDVNGKASIAFIINKCDLIDHDIDDVESYLFQNMPASAKWLLINSRHRPTQVFFYSTAISTESSKILEFRYSEYAPKILNWLINSFT